jgi:hypothetical protein
MLTSVFSGAAVCVDPGVVDIAVAKTIATKAATWLKAISNSP